VNATPAAVLHFWFGEADAVDARWFKRDAGFDAAIAQRFGPAVEAALRGELDAWADDKDEHGAPRGKLGLILLLDQFTRNLFRDSPRAFAGDPRALALALALIDAGDDRRLPPLQRWFAAMPLEHAEDLALQQRCVGLFEVLLAEARAASSPHVDALDGALDYARRHRDVIARFGRFPHRNAVLGRIDTAEEALFLQQPGSRF
jgi:uncharacterized protein (DUF924 family)